jgi:di/tricarboxylate transporter
MTQAVSNNAAAIILTPVAISLAHTEGIEPHAFLIAICFAASAAFMTPLGYQTNLMVYAPGGYRFTDYVRFGAPLNFLLWVLASLLIPFWINGDTHALAPQTSMKSGFESESGANYQNLRRAR